MLEVKPVVNNDDWFQIDQQWCYTKLERSLQLVWSWNECIKDVLSDQKWGNMNLSVPVCFKSRNLTENVFFQLYHNLANQFLIFPEEWVSQVVVACELVSRQWVSVNYYFGYFVMFWKNIECARHLYWVGARSIAIEWHVKNGHFHSWRATHISCRYRRKKFLTGDFKCMTSGVEQLFRGGASSFEVGMNV